ncbi:mg2+ transporter zinc transport protein [Fusarium flagelliforme]|uniref:Mg2+ transporter zinc transport protein n=1 Tax=Fusarium flagelliforme TaxID=2675880 RepID=A0A395MZE2_9HYPO|nr:mg2+ transporter zinc transport protein [Fusarium flagelliforme]
MEDSGRTCTYSFGDDGLTATVSPSGRLLRISRHFPGEKFGYCVDYWDITEPYMAINRITEFVSSANDPDHNIGFYPDLKGFLSKAENASVDFTNDRWPLFHINGGNETCEIQYSISHGAVYQTFDFSNGRPPMTLMSNLLLRQLDFVDDDNAFNEDEDEDDDDDNGYETHLLSEGKCIKRSHKLGQDDNKHAALFVYAFSDNTALTFEEFTKQKDTASEEGSAIGEQGERGEGEAGEASDEETDEDSDEDGDDDEETYYRISYDNEVSQSSKVTFIYVLSLETGELESLPEPPNFTAAPEFPKIDASKRVFTATNPDLNLALRRNLEYILSVCSIPVYPDANDDGEFAVALTCGDIDSHRIVTAASFHCFQFLLLSLKHFVSSLGHDEHDYPEAVNCDACSLIKRIRGVLKGHLKWVFGEKYRNLARNPSCPHTWVNGDEIEGWQDNIYLSNESLVDAPFQFLKAGDYKEYDNRWEVPKTAKHAVRTWVEKLDQKNKLGCYAFPRDMEEPTHNFFLTDHVLIWRTAKCVELLGLKSELSVDISHEDEGGVQKRPRKREYLPSRIQNQILKRFTAENPASKKRMLSVSRSPGHIQFLLRTRDTLLFHVMDSQFFDKPGAKVTHTGNEWQNKIDIWKSLVNCQPLHEDNEDDSWDEPIRFALSIIMAYKGKPMNSLSPREMHKRGMDVLLASKWPNGLFPGQLDIDGEPAIYDEDLKIDEYWSNSFEIPCLLWKYGEYPNERKSTLLSPVAEPELDPELSGSQKVLMEYQKSAKSLEHANSSPMKRTFPWNNVLDQTNIVELSDEWLYNVLDCFKNNDFFDTSYDDCWQLDKVTNADHRPQVCLDGVLIDIPKSKAGNKRLPHLEAMTRNVWRGELRSLMLQKRLPWKAKKRFCVLFSTDPHANMPYPHTIPEADAMFNFYERHKSYNKHFSEDTAAEMNRWTTELHLSFNALDQPTSEESSPVKRATSETKGLKGLVSLVTDVGCKRLRQVVMSLRFDGDFFDRYWTCYFLDCNPQWVGSENLPEARDEIMSALRLILYNQGGTGRLRLDVNKHHWRQRRILELLLFQEMVDRMHHSTVEIMEDSRSIAKEDDIFPNDFDSGPNIRDYDAIRYSINICQKHLREHQQRLQTVEQDMVENFAQIDLWSKRERERQNERPRWTFNDEMKYRSIIIKLLNQNDHTIQDLRRSHSSLRILIEKLNRMLQELERKLERLDKELEKQDRVREANRNADIRRFTYVTVIFLPLGFATGVFSMSGAPSGSTLGNMVLTAVAAFAITALLIICVTNLDVVRKSYWKAWERALILRNEMLEVSDKARDKWEGYRLARESHEENEEAQRTEEQIELVKVRSRGQGGSMRSGRESRDGERSPWHSEGGGQTEAVRGSDNIV